MGYGIYRIVKHRGWSDKSPEVIAHISARSFIECDKMMKPLGDDLPESSILDANCQFLTMQYLRDHRHLKFSSQYSKAPGKPEC